MGSWLICTWPDEQNWLIRSWKVLYLRSLVQQEGGEVSRARAFAKLDPKTPVIQPSRAVCSLEAELPRLVNHLQRESPYHNFSEGKQSNPLGNCIAYRPSFFSNLLPFHTDVLTITVLYLSWIALWLCLASHPSE